MEEFFSSFLRRAGMPASAGLSCFLIAVLLITLILRMLTLNKLGLNGDYVVNYARRERKITNSF